MNRTDGRQTTLTWDEWVAEFAECDVREPKDGPGFVLGVVDEERRLDANVEELHALGVDVEHRTPDQIEAMFRAAAPFEYVLYTTHSHSEADSRFRILFPLDEPLTDVSSANVRAVSAALSRLLGDVDDPKTWNPARFYYSPSAPPDGSPEFFRNEGRFLSLDDLPKVVDLPRESDADLRTQVLSLRRKIKFGVGARHPLKAELSSLARGETLATKGGRHEAINATTWWLAERFPNLDDDLLLAFYEGSLSRMRDVEPDGAPRDDDVLRGYRGALEKIGTLEDEGAVLEVLQRSGAGPYTKKELVRLAEVQGCRVEDLRHRWVVQRESSYWFLGERGEYVGPFTTHEAGSAARDVLARAPVLFDSPSRNGRLGMPELVDRYGRVAQSYVLDLRATKSTFDEPRRAMVDAPCPIRNVEPEYDEGVDEWLRVFAGPSYEKLSDWLACAPDLDRLLCGLYLWGPPGTGKTLFAHALARLWSSSGPTELANVFEDHNEMILKCPVVLGDEQMPTDSRGRSITARLRTLISTKERTVNVKYKPHAVVCGALRLVLASNDEFLLAEGAEVAGAFDVEAVAERFMLVRVGLGARDALESMTHAQRTEFVEERFGRHVLALAQHRTVEPGKRFWVGGDAEEMARMLATQTGANSLVCEWLVRYLEKPRLFDNKGSGLVKVGDGELLVNDQAIVDGWNCYLEKYRPLKMRQVGAALRAISTGEKRRIETTGGRRARFRVIDPTFLIDWAEDHNFGDLEKIIERVLS